MMVITMNHIERIAHLQAQGVNGSVARKLVELEDSVESLKLAIEVLKSTDAYFTSRLEAVRTGKFTITLIEED